MPRYKLRTLLIVLAIGPMVITVVWFAYRLIVCGEIPGIMGPRE